MSDSRAGSASSRPGWLVIGALTVIAVGVAAGVHLGRPFAAEEPKAGAASARKAPAQTSAEADAALDALMKARRDAEGAATPNRRTTAPKFAATPRKDSIAKFPCTKCHDNSFVDRRVRTLVEEHKDLAFDHGGGRFWCYDACHSGRDIDALVSLRGRRVDYDEVYKVCGQCHSQRERDWRFGGHGKRAGAWKVQREIPLTAAELLVTDREQIGTWGDSRVRLNCTECHDPHSPSVKPFEASPPPGTRPGVSPGSRTRAPEPKVWERLETERKAR